MLKLTTRYLQRLSANAIRPLLDGYLALLSSGLNKELARRSGERGRSSLRWFTPEEVAVAEALAGIIVPSDEETPGIDDVSVLDPPAIVSIDRMVSTSPGRQYLYSHGLLSFDLWALWRYKRKFADLSQQNQIALLKAAEQLQGRRSERMSVIKKLWSRLEAIIQVNKGTYYAPQLFWQIRNDCLQVFYTSRVSWVWLEYDGPPMDKGYSNLVAPREF
jgi:hypothetical protein